MFGKKRQLSETFPSSPPPSPPLTHQLLGRDVWVGGREGTGELLLAAIVLLLAAGALGGGLGPEGGWGHA